MSHSNLKYYGHSAWILTLDSGYVVAIDPWLEGNPSCPASLKNPDKIDLICLTHGHSDHAGDAVRLSNQTGAKICATWELCSILNGEGISQDLLIPMNKGGSIILDEVTVSLTDAKHSSSYDSPSRGTLYAGEACGVIVKSPNKTIYHAGDTLLFSDMRLIKDQWSPDIALLPIGDRFTMNPQTASQASSLINAKLSIPMHYGTFPILTGSPKDFATECKKIGVECSVLGVGEVINFRSLV